MVQLKELRKRALQRLYFWGSCARVCFSWFKVRWLLFCLWLCFCEYKLCNPILTRHILLLHFKFFICVFYLAYEWKFLFNKTLNDESHENRILAHHTNSIPVHSSTFPASCSNYHSIDMQPCGSNYKCCCKLESIITQNTIVFRPFNNQL